MQLDWLIHPLIGYALLSAALLACLYLFVITQRRITEIGSQCRKTQSASGLAIDELRCGLESVRKDLNAVEQRWQTVESPFAPQPAPAFNINKRSQVLRLARRGDRPDQISAALRVPQHEVNLILKIHRSLLRLS